MIVPYPSKVATRVHDTLWLGGSWREFPVSRPFDLVITVCNELEVVHTPDAAKHLRLAMQDVERVDEEAVDAVSAVIVKATRRRMRTLVRCHAGLNRSALVIALAMVELSGKSGVEITRRLREARSPSILYNRAFAAYVANRR